MQAPHVSATTSDEILSGSPVRSSAHDAFFWAKKTIARPSQPRRQGAATVLTPSGLNRLRLGRTPNEPHAEYENADRKKAGANICQIDEPIWRCCVG